MAVNRFCSKFQKHSFASFLWESVGERPPAGRGLFSEIRDCTNDVQEIVTTEDGLGITDVDGLSKKDLERVRSLALIDLTALFDLYGITYVRRKAKSRGRGWWFQLVEVIPYFLIFGSC